MALVLIVKLASRLQVIESTAFVSLCSVTLCKRDYPTELASTVLGIREHKMEEAHVVQISAIQMKS